MEAASSLSALARRRYCAPTKAFAAGDCAVGGMGSWPFHGLTPLASCVQRCAESCAQCRFVSYSAITGECSWYHDCDMERLQTKHSRDHQTIAVASLAWAALKPTLVLAPRPAEAPLCDAGGRQCVQVVAYDTENSEMYPPEQGAAGMPMPFAVHFVHPPASLAADASMKEKLHLKFKAFQDSAENQTPSPRP